MESILWEAPMIAYRPVESQQPSSLQDKHIFCESDLLFDRHRCEQDDPADDIGGYVPLIGGATVVFLAVEGLWVAKCPLS